MGLGKSELNRFTTIIDRNLSPLGFLCSKLEWDGRDRTLRVYIKKDDTQPKNLTVTIEDCVRATKVLRKVEELDQVYGNGDFILEVSSPGTDGNDKI